MTLNDVEKRLSELDEEVRGATAAETVEAASKEKQDLLIRHGELKDLQQRKQTALNLQSGQIAGMVIEQKATEETSMNIGEHFIKHCGQSLKSRKQRFSLEAPEYQVRAATDPHVTGSQTGVFAGILNEYDTRMVRNYRRPTVSDIFTWGTITGQAITYFVEGAREGNMATVAEGAAKPQIKYADPTSQTDALTKIAGVIKISDEMTTDLPFMVSEINGRLVYDLSLVVESQLLNGSGTAPNLRGLLNRSGIQTLTSASYMANADSLFMAKTNIATATGLNADAIIINPADYQNLRLSKDSNNQYYGGGFFQGQYGNSSGLEWEPPLWGLRTVVTPAVASGMAIVGAFAQGATAYSKGGVVIESTNSNEDDFKKNLIAIRAEQRIALAVRIPAAFVKVTFATLVP